MQQDASLHRIRFWVALFIVGLVLSGLTAFPLQTELDWFVPLLHRSWLEPVSMRSGLLPWVEKVASGVRTTNAQFPFMAYGTDWLAFGHLVIAVAFIGAYRDPLPNKWIIDFGLIACAGVIPLALIAGHVRGIPLGWRFIDSSFGFFGSLPLLRCKQLIARLETLQV